VALAAPRRRALRAGRGRRRRHLTAAIFDAAAIRARRIELFPPAAEAPPWPANRDGEHFGLANRHCGICPKAENEHCGLSCETARKAINDGVIVTMKGAR
jgi:hypothetical protein